MLSKLFFTDSAAASSQFWWRRFLPLLLVSMITVGQSGLFSAVKAQSTSDPLNKPLLNASSFSYIGSFQMPPSYQGVDFGFSNGGLAYRYVNGSLHFLSTAHAYTGGLVYEVACPGFSTTSPPQATVSTFWGDVYSGHKSTTGGGNGLGGGNGTYGLYYDQTSNVLMWNYGWWYNTENPYDLCLGYSILNDQTGVATGIASYKLNNVPEHWTRGGVTPIPQWFANKYTGGMNLAVDFGGYFSIISSGSLGPTLVATTSPVGIADQSALPSVVLMGYPVSSTQDSNHGRGWRLPNYFSSFDGGNWNPSPLPAGISSPFADGSTTVGFETWDDNRWQGGTWIDLPNAAGVVFLTKRGSGNVYYQDSTTNAQGGYYEWAIVNPKDLADVATGSKQSWQIQPTYIFPDSAVASNLPISFDAGGFSGTGSNEVSIVYDPQAQRLYVGVLGGWAHEPPSIEPYMTVHAFQVVAPSGGGGGGGGGGTPGGKHSIHGGHGHGFIGGRQHGSIGGHHGFIGGHKPGAVGSHQHGVAGNHQHG